jgi:hypothetical protein
MCCLGGDEDTGGDSNGRGTDNNQQSTKSSQWRRAHVGRVMPAGMAGAAAATAALPPRTATVAMKTPAVTAIMGAQATIDNQLKAANSDGRPLAAQRRLAWPRQPPPLQCCHRKRGGSTGAAASLAAMAEAWQEHGVGGSGSAAAA